MLFIILLFGTLSFPAAMNRRRGKDVYSNLLVGGSRIWCRDEYSHWPTRRQHRTGAESAIYDRVVLKLLKQFNWQLLKLGRRHIEEIAPFRIGFNDISAALFTKTTSQHHHHQQQQQQQRRSCMHHLYDALGLPRLLRRKMSAWSRLRFAARIYTDVGARRKASNVSVWWVLCARRGIANVAEGCGTRVKRLEGFINDKTFLFWKSFPLQPFFFFFVIDCMILQAVHCYFWAYPFLLLSFPVLHF